jgi:zinc protease
MRRFMPALIILVCVLLMAPAVQAALFKVERFTLDNGMEVVVIPNHRAPVVTHMVWYKFGRADEAPGKSGVAHFLEHLMFKGTPAMPDGAFSQTVKQLGGNDNAFTSSDYTAYYQNIGREHLEKMMQMEADRMVNLILNEKEVASEREVIIEERRQRIDNQPQARFQEQVMSALFVNHPYAVPVIGWLHEMRALTREDALDNYRRWYAPNNAILVVSGDITAAELKPLAQKIYGSLPRKDIPARNRPRPAPIVADVTLTMQDPQIGVPVLTKTARVARADDRLDMLAEIFGGDTTSRLYKNLVVNKKLATNAGASYDGISLDDTTFSIYASPAPGTSIAQLEAALQQEIQDILSRGVTLEELQSAKKRRLANLTYYLDSLQGPALLLGRALSSGYSLEHVQSLPERIEKITLDDISAAAKIVFSPDNKPVTGVLLPQKNIPDGKTTPQKGTP